MALEGFLIAPLPCVVLVSVWCGSSVTNDLARPNSCSRRADFFEPHTAREIPIYARVWSLRNRLLRVRSSDLLRQIVRALHIWWSSSRRCSPCRVSSVSLPLGAELLPEASSAIRVTMRPRGIPLRRLVCVSRRILRTEVPRLAQLNTRPLATLLTFGSFQERCL